MAHQLTGKTIASTFEQLFYRGTSEPGATNDAEYILTSQNDQTDDITTALAVGTARVGIGTDSPDCNLHIQESAVSHGSNATDSNSVLVLEETDAHYIEFITGDNSEVGMIFSTGDAADEGRIGYHPNNGAGYLNFYTVAGEKMRITSDGEVGIGTNNPSPGKLHIADTADTTAYSDTTMSSTGSLLTLENSNASAAQCMISFLCQASSGQAQGIIGIIDAGGNNQANMVFGCRQDGGSDEIIERMRITHAGEVGIGTTAPNLSSGSGTTLTVAQTTGDFYPMIELAGNRGVGGNQNGSISFWNLNGGNTEVGRIISLNTASTEEGQLTFWTKGGSILERMRIDEDGNVGIGTTSPGKPLSVVVPDGVDNQMVASFTNADADNPEGILILFSGGNFTDAAIQDDRFILCQDNDSDNFAVYSDGGVLYDEVDTHSDVRLKENIVDATPKLDDINKLKVRNFNFKHKTDPDACRRIGFIADEVEEVFPKIIKKRAIKKFGVEYTDLKHIRYEPIIAILVKAVQELSAKVEALENNNNQGDSSNEQEQDSGGGDSSSESSGEDSGGTEGNSSDSSSSTSGASETSESSSDDGGESSGSSGSDASDDS